MKREISPYFLEVAGSLIKSNRSSWPTQQIVDKNGKTRTVRINPAKLEEKPAQPKARAKSTSDTELIANILAGSKAAQSDLYAKYKQDVFKVISTFVRDVETVRDLTADTFVKAFSKMEEYAKVSKTLQFKNWLVRVASNTARDYLRSAHSAMANNQVSEETRDFHFNSMVESESPDQVLEAKEAAQKIHDALQKLPEQYSSAIVEFYFNGLSVKEIAAKYGISESGVTQRLTRGKQALKGILSNSLYKALEPYFEVLDSIYEVNLVK